MSDDKPRTDISYLQACHGVQTGIAHALEKDPDIASPKHLRVGLDLRACEHTALVRLLIAKGIITIAEYSEEVRLETCREVDRAEDRIRAETGAKVTLR